MSSPRDPAASRASGREAVRSGAVAKARRALEGQADESASTTPAQGARMPWWRRVDVQVAVAACVWLGSILAAVAVEAWPMVVLLIVLGVVLVRVLQVLAYRD